MLEVVGVGGLLNRQVEPVTGVAVRPDVHAGQQVAFILRNPVQYPVDHGHGLRAGDVGVGTESAVLEALDPAQLRSPLDVLLRPVTLNIGEGLLAVALAGVEPGADGGELSAGDGRLGVEGRGAAALHDAQTGHGGDGGVGPVIVRHVGVGVAGEQIAVTDGILQQAEENGGGLRTGDQAVGPDVAVLVADDIGKVVAVIQQVGGGAAVVPHGDRVLDGGAPAVGEVLGLDLMLHAVQNVALGSRDLGIVPDAVIGVLVVHAEQGNAALGTVPGGLSRCPVDRFAFAVILLIQLEGRAVQGMAVLRVHLLNGEEVIVIVAVIAADAAGNGIGNRGLRKFLLFHRHTGAVFGLQNGAFFRPSDPPHRKCRVRFHA